ncbi:16S rRNA (guanine(966)-N(2))-methyltransferase RsmD [Komagataeibacter saccharivorans]|uniref:16S rRNA (guanine(966)-N(2))-methyltransferase RsmD n=1 Tax=Komagataeibacter saccharivorans TaxID=265959 RepID=UPI000D7CB09F|nr:16S rRNA (guanine(966)-N(2))-methyltransferase RsmD [Komagataeibacter saccharivorans]PYD51751.1 16S rRNA (guanine(966)-N(2))-methyltransferase RsmD [Komagataeibacter saccharivorans]GBQ35590.1 N-6 adenine-specific DNA methylase [Komagataeibacter saccharivorans NRIC 0614]
MRIIAGECRGRSLHAPPGQTTRPTADRVRQALFDSLSHAPWAGADMIRGARVLDGFAGTGALGLEALSRGAGAAIFVEQDRAALRALRENVTACGMSGRAVIRAMDMLRLPPCDQVGPVDLVFLDPPYNRDLPARALAVLERGGWLRPSTLIVVETAATESLPVAAERLLLERRHGAARLSVWRHESGAAA